MWLYHRPHGSCISAFVTDALLLQGQIPLGSLFRLCIQANLRTSALRTHCIQGKVAERCSRIGRRKLGYEVRADPQGSTSVSSMLSQSLSVSSGFQCISYLIHKFLTWEVLMENLGDWLRAAMVPHPICVMFLVVTLFYFILFTVPWISTHVEIHGVTTPIRIHNSSIRKLLMLFLYGPSILNPRSVLHHDSFIVSTLSYKWNQTVCRFLKLASFTQNNALEIHPCVCQ